MKNSIARHSHIGLACCGIIMVLSGCATPGEVSCPQIREVYRSSANGFDSFKIGQKKDSGEYAIWSSSYIFQEADKCRITHWAGGRKEFSCRWYFDYFGSGTNDAYKALKASVESCVRGGEISTVPADRENRTKAAFFTLNDSSSSNRLEISIYKTFSSSRKEPHVVSIKFERE